MGLAEKGPRVPGGHATQPGGVIHIRVHVNVLPGAVQWSCVTHKLQGHPA